MFNILFVNLLTLLTHIFGHNVQMIQYINYIFFSWTSPYFYWLSSIVYKKELYTESLTGNIS